MLLKRIFYRVRGIYRFIWDFEVNWKNTTHEEMSNAYWEGK